MSQYDFQRYLDNKYDPVQLGQVHHYETKELRLPDGALILQAGLEVDADFTFSYSYESVEYNKNDVISVSNLQYEIDKNDAKRSNRCIWTKQNSPKMSYDRPTRLQCGANVIPTWPPHGPTIILTSFQHHPTKIPG